VVLVLKDVRKFSVFPVAAIDDPVLSEVLAELAAARADEMDADTVNRELSIARKAIGWWQRQGWIECDFSQVTALCSAVVIWLVVAEPNGKESHRRTSQRCDQRKEVQTQLPRLMTDARCAGSTPTTPPGSSRSSPNTAGQASRWWANREPRRYGFLPSTPTSPPASSARHSNSWRLQSRPGNPRCFELFLSERRTSLPDVDLDVESERRLEVYDAIIKRFGRERTA
jgi:hypothetical protein